MKVTDRALFRALVESLHARTFAHAAAATTLVTVACGAQGTVVKPEVIIPPQPPAPPARVLRVAAVPKSSASAEPPAPADEGDDDEPDDSDLCGEVDARSVTRAAGPCTNDLVVPAGASLACPCGPNHFGASKCASYKNYLKPRIAKVALDCLARLAPTCLGCGVYACGDRAMKGSCADPTADVECRALAKQCPSMPLDICGRYMSALNAAGRTKLKACMTRCTLYSCAEGL